MRTILCNFPVELEMMVAPKAAKPKNWPLIVSILSLAVTVIGIPLMFFSWIEPHLQNDQKNQISLEVGAQLKDPVSRMGEMNAHLAKIEQMQDDFKPFIHDVVSHQFDSLAKLPTQTLLGRISAVERLLAVAKDQAVRANPRAVRETGTKFVLASAVNPDAWKASLGFLTYSSSLNDAPEIRLGPLTPMPAAGYDFSIQWKEDPTQIKNPTKELMMGLYTAGGPASTENSARMERLDKPQSKSTGVAYLILKGGTRASIIGLDGDYLKNVIIVGARIEYDGGPVRLDNVTFVDCTFEMKPMKRTQDLAIAMLTSSDSTTFSGV